MTANAKLDDRYVRPETVQAAVQVMTQLRQLGVSTESTKLIVHPSALERKREGFVGRPAWLVD